MQKEATPSTWQFSLAGLLTAACVISGCSSDSGPIKPPPVPVSARETKETGNKPTVAVEDSRSVAQAGTTVRRYGALSFEIPASWQEIANAQMVDSKFTIPTESGDCEITLTTMGGGIEANLTRWVGQIQMEPGDEPEWTTVSIAGIDSRMVDVRGSFNTTVGENPGLRENWRLIGIAVPQERDFFVKLIGPRDAITGLQDELLQFLKTGRTND